jgi:hypothetical protein
MRSPVLVNEMKPFVCPDHKAVGLEIMQQFYCYLASLIPQDSPVNR